MDILANTETPPFTLQGLDGFPYDEYTKLLSRYDECEEWYSGKALEQIKQKDGKNVELYPVKVNPIKSGVQKHAFALFGEVEEDEKPLVNTRAIQMSEGDKEAAELVENILTQIWWENNGRANQWQNGAISQVYGGCVWKVSYDPFDVLKSVPIRIEIPHPKYFVGVPDANDMWRLKEAWFVKPITDKEAVENGYQNVSMQDPMGYWLLEHWTPSIYDARVNEQPARRYVDGKWMDISGPNDFGVVPAVYIPHIRIEGFYGENFFDVVKGIIKEMNLRIADYGDAVSVDAHAYLGMTGIQGSPTIMKLAPGVNAINLPSSPSITGNEKQANLWEVRSQSASQSMESLYQVLYDQYRRDAFIPKVAEGEDEGSQRSGLTLAMRMLSLLWHTQIERYFWTTGLNLFNRIILRMLAVKEGASTGITIKHATMRTKQEWSPSLPRDREMLVNEVVARMGTNLGSPETLFDILGDISDTDLEKKRILDFKKALTEASAVQQPKKPVSGTNRKQVSPGSPTDGSSDSE
jgi:hypothetical protein